jgi:hypothetical protein
VYDAKRALAELRDELERRSAPVDPGPATVGELAVAYL